MGRLRDAYLEGWLDGWAEANGRAPDWEIRRRTDWQHSRAREVEQRIMATLAAGQPVALTTHAAYRERTLAIARGEAVPGPTLWLEWADDDD